MFEYSKCLNTIKDFPMPGGPQIQIPLGLSVEAGFEVFVRYIAISRAKFLKPNNN